MSQQEIQPKGVIRLYGAGGAGINIISSWDQLDRTTLPGGAECQVVYVDTSRSNLPEAIDKSKLYLLENVDGSGKVRAENHVEIGRNIRSVLQKHTPGDLNVVCFSASGGSGSVFGPLIIGELIERGAPVIALVIGSEESSITRRNTQNTLKSLEAISKKKGVPVVMSYHHNTPNEKRSNIDIECRFILAALSILASRRNVALDTMDLVNFLNFPKVTALAPQLALIHVYKSTDDVNSASNPVAIASLLKSPDEPSHSLTPEYVTVGYPRDEIKDFDQLHYVITLDGVQVIFQNIVERVSQVDKASAARVQHDSIVSEKDIVTDDGLVL